MDPLPIWLENAVAAAGVTAYAFDFDRGVSAFSVPAHPAEDEDPEPPLH